MAKQKVNKAAKIREVFDNLGHEVRTKDVVATLAQQKITVAPAQVSNIKASLMHPTKKKTNGTGDKISIADLQSAKKLVDVLGSLEAAKTALDVLGKLREDRSLLRSIVGGVMLKPRPAPEGAKHAGPTRLASKLLAEIQARMMNEPPGDKPGGFFLR